MNVRLAVTCVTIMQLVPTTRVGIVAIATPATPAMVLFAMTFKSVPMDMNVMPMRLVPILMVHTFVYVTQDTPEMAVTVQVSALLIDPWRRRHRPFVIRPR